MFAKNGLDRIIGFHNTFYTKCINDIIDSIGPSIILRSIFVLQIHFLMCISANITHLRETRFATLNAYEEADEAQNSKHIVDTTM